MGFNMLLNIIFGTNLLTKGPVPVSIFLPISVFLQNTEIGEKHQFWAGPPVNRLVPKII